MIKTKAAVPMSIGSYKFVKISNDVTHVKSQEMLDGPVKQVYTQINSLAHWGLDILRKMIFKRKSL